MTEAPQSLQELVANPLRFIARGAVDACLDGALADAELERLLDLVRFRQRLVERLQRCHGLVSFDVAQPADPQDLQLLALDEPRLASLPVLCGALWHAVALAREIRRDAVQYLRQQLGAETFACAVSHRDQAAAVDCLLEGERLVTAIHHDGQVCLGTWLHTRPPPLRAWLKLRWPDWPVATDEPPEARLACVHTAVQWLHQSREPES